MKFGWWQAIIMVSYRLQRLRLCWKVGKLEWWNIGLTYFEGVIINKSFPLPNIPLFHHSSYAAKGNPHTKEPKRR
jgi:hypothetical protein